VWINRVPRVKNFAFRGYHRYFVTLTTNFRKRVFASEMHARALSEQIPPFFSTRSFEVLAYCVMPDPRSCPRVEGANRHAALAARIPRPRSA
jgi:hypothetical protein